MAVNLNAVEADIEQLIKKAKDARVASKAIVLYLEKKKLLAEK